MTTKFVAILALAAGLVAGSLLMVQAQTDTKPPPPDPRVQKLLDTNDQILKNQDQILKNQDQMMNDIAEIKKGVFQLRVRSS
jgi:hypothetical protein